MYSLMVSLTNRKVTIIGGGQVAYRKAKGLMEEKCEIVVISPKWVKDFENVGCTKINRAYREGDCKGSFLVFAATNDPIVNQKVFMECERNQILCNMVDDGSHSHFITPAQMKRGDLTISVSTGGKSPSLAVQIKKELEEIYGEAYQERIELLGKIRDYWLIYEKDNQQKKELLQKVAKMKVEEIHAYLLKEHTKLYEAIVQNRLE